MFPLYSNILEAKVFIQLEKIETKLAHAKCKAHSQFL